jgi:hypothetical protein
LQGHKTMRLTVGLAVVALLAIGVFGLQLPGTLRVPGISAIRTKFR